MRTHYLRKHHEVRRAGRVQQLLPDARTSRGGGQGALSATRTVGSGSPTSSTKTKQSFKTQEIAEKFYETDGVNTKGVTNIREFLTDLDFSHGRDFFLTPRCVSVPSDAVRPVFTS